MLVLNWYLLHQLRFPRPSKASRGLSRASSQAVFVRLPLEMP
ncbi:hypothetical protein Z043_109465 [Scleropages formosus]|uniref:Uncharacterized protein n=1 Tax=Scleropages formosus TaxID=113540 RepID=A0A0P7XA84_SCLFO|nr:hypothetical protein Z043_109465 [Scleropages formosus]